MSEFEPYGDQIRHRVRTAFVDVLERTPLMRSPTSRLLLLDQLRDRLGSFPLREHSELRLQTAELVHACIRIADGLDRLVETVEHLEPATQEAIELRRLQDTWEAADALTQVDWEHLRPALEQLHPTNLGTIYQRATEHRLPGPPTWCDNAWHAFIHLAGQNAGPDGLPPSLVFLELLEDLLDAQAARRVRIRNRRVASQQGLAAERERRRAYLRAGGELPVDASVYLVIQIEPRLDADRQEAYTISPFHQWRGPESWHSRRRKPRIALRHELEHQVERLIEETEVEWTDHVGPIVIEFILPWELLNADVDWWRMETDSPRPIVLAMDYPVVVRSLERHRTPRWHRTWQRRWQQLQIHPAGSLVRWSRPNGDDYLNRLETELKADDRVVCLVLSEPPARLGERGQQEVFAALRAGLPVIIWHRNNCGAPAFRRAVSDLVAEGGLAELPARARRLRQRALQLDPALRTDHVGRHLTVLWDDPERRPDLLGAPIGTGSGAA